MKLGELLRENQVLVGLSARDKWEALGKMVDALVAQGRLRPEQRGPVQDALVAREKVASTGMEFGIAIPHAPVDGIDETLAVLGLSPGIAFQTPDNLPARILVLLVIPRKSVQKHIRTLADIARLLSYEEVREALSRARSPREALQVIRDEEQRL
jgi:mannitol/fructose-specific phosphotransferase system IIA component (Ntr-type)